MEDIRLLSTCSCMAFSLAVQVLLVHLLLTFLYFESQDCVMVHSCQDVLLRRWSVLKGTVVAMTAGISFTASARILQDEPMATSFSFGTAVIGTFALFSATSNSRVFKVISVASSTLWLLWSDPVRDVLPSLQLIWFFGTIGLLLNILHGGRVIKWYPETKRLIFGTLLLAGGVVCFLEAYHDVVAKPFWDVLFLSLCLCLLGRLGCHKEFL